MPGVAHPLERQEGGAALLASFLTVKCDCPVIARDNMDGQLDMQTLDNSVANMMKSLELLCNSIDALLTDKPNNPCTKLRVTTKDNRPVITVFNNGGMISDKAINRLYEPYFSTKSVSAGSGLGLYLVKMVVERELKGRTMKCERTLNVSQVLLWVVVLLTVSVSGVV
ncbi:MAG: HAMP domain-containing histidine kinase [Nitrospirae bacterium]|nr:HAMP domain-containing histidine kinase [Nitrospirota bacterium]